MNLGGTAINPLVEGDRLQAYRLCAQALPRLAEAAATSRRASSCAPRRCLQNREADDGGGVIDRHWVMRVAYALSTALIAHCRT